MMYRPTPNPETWRTLDQIRKEIDEGKWWHGRIYEEIQVAIATNHVHDFWDLPDTLQAYLIAAHRAKGLAEAYEMKLREKDQGGSKKPTAPNSPLRRRR